MKSYFKKLDAHERFRLEETIAYKHDFLHRPIVNEYVEVLWLLMKQLWPALSRKKRKYKYLVSCDVDHPLMMQWIQYIEFLEDFWLEYFEIEISI